MKVLSFHNFLNENNNEPLISASNFLKYKDKIKVQIALSGDDNLDKGFKFTVDNIADYDTDEFTQQIIDTFFVKINKIVSKIPNFFKEEDKGYTGYKSVGKNYDRTKNMDITEIAKLVKKEMNIEFPDWVFKVKTSRYSGGQSLDVYIEYIPYNPFSEDAQEMYSKGENYSGDNRYESKYSQEYLSDSKKLTSMINQYRMDDSDGQIDYFHTNFYGHVNLESDKIMAHYYPNHPEVLRSLEWNTKYAEQDKIRKEALAKKKSELKFKKGDEIIYIYDKADRNIPKGEYFGEILKAPNGRAFFSKYDIRFYVTKGFKDGVEVELTKPRIYTTTLYDQNKLKLK